MIKKDNPIDSAESRLLISELQTQMTGVATQLENLTNTVALIPRNSDNLPAIPQAVNQIWNGSFSHSVNSWDNVATANNGRYQCKQYYSHPTADAQPMFKANQIAGQATLTLGTVDTGADTIEITGHFLQTGTPFTLTGTIPAPLATSTIYYVIRVDADLIQVAASYDDAAAGTEIDLTNTNTGGSLLYDYTLKDDSATTYTPQFSDWDIPTGSARLMPNYDLSTWLPGNNIEPAYTYYAVFSCVRRDRYVTAADDVRIKCGLYHKSTANGWEWISAPYVIEAEVLGTVTTPTARDYLIHVQTSRGFTINSSVLTVANAPSDADFAAGARVVLTWKKALNYGVVGYSIYRDTSGTFVRLQTVSSGTQMYIDNGSFQESVGAYPSADYDKLVALTGSIQGAIPQIPALDDPNFTGWNTMPYAIKTPQDYNRSDTINASGQWLRWYVDGALDYRVTECTFTLNSGIVTNSAGVFTSDMVGKTCTLSAKNGTSDHTIVTYTSADEIEVFPNWLFSTVVDAGTIYINDGAPAHSIAVDLAHLSYQEGASFAPNPEDISPSRGTPAAVPNGSTQGPIIPPGGTGGNDGFPTCLYENQPVETPDGEIPAKDLCLQMKLPDGYGGFNTINKIEKFFAEVYLVETENGKTLLCTETKKIYTPKGTRLLSQLKKGDKIITVTDKLEASPIALIEKLPDKHIVVQIGLWPRHSFISGGILVDNTKPILVDVPTS